MRNTSQNKRLDRIPKRYRDEVESDLGRIAEKIKKRRQQKELTQEGLAELLNIEPATLQSIEQQRGRPSIELLLAIVKILEMRLTLK